MKSLLIPFAALTAGSLLGCSTSKEDYQQAIESDLTETTVLINTLTILDSGDVAKARKIAIVPVLMNLDGVRYYAIKRMASLTPDQRQEWAKVARSTVDYMLAHRDEWDSRRLDVQAGLRGLRYFLTQPEDVRRVEELSSYLARDAQKRLEAQ